LSKSGVSKLAEAVSWFEEELKRLYEESVSKSNDLVRFGDDMARELREDIEAALAGIIADLREEALKVEEALRADYERRLGEELRSIEVKSAARFERAVRAVLEEVKRIVQGA
jgi:predicted metal-dependent hydrolase